MKPKHLQPILDELRRAEVANVAMVKALADRMARIEMAQAEQLKRFDSITEFLSLINQAYKKHDADALDRGQTASALYGLIKRLDDFEKAIAFAVVGDLPLNQPVPTPRPKKREPA